LPPATTGAQQRPRSCIGARAVQESTPIRLESFVTYGTDRLWLWLARRLPRRLRYWAVVHGWAETTADDRCPSPPAPALTVGELVARLKE
jgi:hypothetical protein